MRSKSLKPQCNAIYAIPVLRFATAKMAQITLHTGFKTTFVLLSNFCFVLIHVNIKHSVYKLKRIAIIFVIQKRG